MNKSELRTLRGQLLLTAALLAACAAGAVAVATQRAFFESRVYERYAALPADLRPLAEAAAKGQLDAAALAKVPPEQRVLLYDDWMDGNAPSVLAPRALVGAEADLFVPRAERTLVCGRADQRAKGLRFLALSGSPRALPALHRARQWAQRTRQPGLAKEIDATIAALQAAADGSFVVAP